MNPNYLDFEQPIAELEVKIEELRLVGTDNQINISEEIATLRDKSNKLTEKIYANLSPWDIVKVARELKEMGVIVDAYFDLGKRQWIGTMNEQTRYLVVGRFPVQSAMDPNRDEKTKLIDAMSQAIESARLKNVQSVNFRDFFPRTGYKVKLDVTDDKINQATAPYLQGVSASDSLPPGRN